MKKCPECSGAATDHWSVWANSTLDVCFSSFSIYSHITAVARVATPLLWPFIRVCNILGIVTFNDDITLARNSRSRAIWEEAQRRGIRMQQLRVFGRPTDFFVAEFFGEPHLFDSLPIPSMYGRGEPWADDKHRLKLEFKKHGVATPVTDSVTTLGAAKTTLEQLKVVCVKPRSGSVGRHTFPHVTTETELAEAFWSAKRLCHTVSVEEHLEGNLARATCVDGKLIGFLESQYPTVVGDGKSTVQELVDEANRNRPEKVATIELTSVHKKYIARRGYTPESVLEVGKALSLVYWAGYNSGGSNVEHANIHPELKSEIERAARLTGLPVVGFDLIIEDPKKSPSEQKWGIIEANSRPWIDLHLTPLHGTPVRVAPYIWDLWLAGQQTVSVAQTEEKAA